MRTKKIDEERRGAPRYSLERLAKIQAGIGTPRYCFVTDTSDVGVQIRTFGYKVPHEFLLLLSGDGPAKDGIYKVVWRNGIYAGARLVKLVHPERLKFYMF